MVGHTAMAVANYFVSIKGAKIRPLKIQKLVYVAHGWHLALYSEPLVGDEWAEAWEYGPVFPSVYHAFKKFGRRVITEYATEWTYTDDENAVVDTPHIPRTDTRTRVFLNRIWRVYKKFTDIEMSNITHEPGSPWAQVRKSSAGRRNEHIDDEVIRSYYLRKHHENKQRATAST